MKTLNDNDPVIMWMFSEFDAEAYNQGREACINGKPGNPYKKETNKWYNWNKGWSSVDE